jgi:tetratricopeptide (TPR) repeat protein
VPNCVRLAALLIGCGLAGDPIASTVAAALRQAPRHDTHLTEPARLSTIYDEILSGRSADARALLARACPPAPSAACDDLREVMLWWEIQQDLSSRSLDRSFEEAARTAIASATAFTSREPQRAEAWFYLAAAYAPLAQWRVLRDQRLAAARDGKRIKDALERAIALDPGLHDAWFGIGLYHYYADVAPVALKFLRMLLLLPGGNRSEGLREMVRAREQGEILRGEADYQMHWLYLWYEKQPERALDLLRGLDRRYPTNPLFLQRIAEVEHEYGHDHTSSAASWQQLLDRAVAGRVTFTGSAAARARGPRSRIDRAFTGRPRDRHALSGHRLASARAIRRARARIPHARRCARARRRSIARPRRLRTGARGSARGRS